MTIVTTSRKAADDLRALARHLAFATGARYLARGKTGLAALSDEPVILFTRERGALKLQVVEDGVVAHEFSLGKVMISERNEPISHTIHIADPSVYDVLKRYCVAEQIEADVPSVVFDGQQKKRIVLEVIPHA
ncbi:hypothetical protein [uncultured Methanofollis sp.]|uniref:hypothetical protein n=1 Tax=uncultured Methanofollis sp. TaxID=262500 RepID=UPI002615B9F2|nr:hypothetical protein [uncultured Methanofollis sp.]